MKALVYKKSLFVIFILLALGGGFFWLAKKYNFFRIEREELISNGTPNPTIVFSPSTTPIKTPTPSVKASPTPTPRPSSVTSGAPQNILLSVPFFAQAPFGEWDDPIFQDGCEEASVIMAWHWVQGTAVTKEQAKQEIIAISEFEDKTYGHAPDRSAADTARLFEDYYGYKNIEVRAGIGAKDIKEALLAGNLVITPVNGRILKNPFYTAPGPEHHMVVVIGYDSKTDEFITNDIGTRHGEKFRYSVLHFQESLQDYPTGDHLPSIFGDTAMIVVAPK
jgi:hypothetical protein